MTDKQTGQTEIVRPVAPCPDCGSPLGDCEDLDVQAILRARALAEIGDPSAFWSSLTPAQALALLRAAPKVAGPWRQTGSAVAERQGAFGWAAGANATGRWGLSGSDNRYADVETLDAAKAAADDALRAAGWVLVDG